MNFSQIMTFLKEAIFHAKKKGFSFLKYYRSLFMFIFIATILATVSALATYWYKAIYEPKKKIEKEVLLSIDKITKGMDIDLEDFAIPIRFYGFLDENFLFSTTPEKVWNNETVSRYWLKPSDMGLDRVIKDSDSLIKNLVDQWP